MAEVVIPEIKHEYIRQVDTETTKDDWFDECIADNKEAAWAGIGTGELDSQYQPSPVKEPDYYMQYCSSDDYDYLKDYRLIWGYGIGIIEQDVICSLSTGEHLAEGKDACDTYATENAAGENVDWKRGIWLKFSGNRNNSPARIGEVVLPDYIISLKDLCKAISRPFINNKYTNINIEGFNTEHIINMQEMLYITKGNTDSGTGTVKGTYSFKNCLNARYAFRNNDCKFANFINVDNSCDYYALFYDGKIADFDDFKDYQIGAPYMFYDCNITTGNKTLLNNSRMILYDYMFYNISSTELLWDENNIPNFTCSDNISNCFNSNIQNFKGYKIDVLPNIDFTNCLTFNQPFNFKVNKSCQLDCSTIDINSTINTLLEIDSENDITITIIPFKDYIKSIGNFIIGKNNINIVFTKDVYVSKSFSSRTAFIQNCNKIIGTFYGCSLFNTELMEGSNVTVKHYINTIDDFIDWITDNRNRDRAIGDIYSTNALETIADDIYKYINLDDYLIVNNMTMCYKNNSLNTARGNYKLYNINHTIDKRNKEAIIFCPSMNQRHNITIKVNNNSKILITSCCFDSLYNYYKTYLNNDDYDKLPVCFIDNEDEQPLDINWRFYTDYAEDSINIINAPKCNLYMDGGYGRPDICRAFIDKANSITYNLDYEVIVNNCDNIYFDYSANYRTQNNFLYIGNSENLNIHSDYHVEIKVYNTLINNLYRFKNSNDEYEDIDYLYENNELHFPKINTITEGILRPSDYIQGAFVDTPYSELLYRVYYSSSNSAFVTDYYQFANENFIKDEIPNNVFVPYNNTNTYGYIRLNLDLYEYDFQIKIGGINNRILKLGYNNKVISAGNVYVEKDSRVNYIQITMENVDKIKSININCECDLFKITNYKHNELIITANSYIDRFSTGDNNTLTNLSITLNKNKINEFCNIKNETLLTQESINSIVNPTNFASGCTLTINTIPFQYITEEQKQALVDAGVTLVEYIPTETTE